MSESFYRTTFETPLGIMIGVATEKGLCALEFEVDRRMSMLERRFGRWYSFNGAPADAACPALEATSEWLNAYFSRQPAPLPPLDARGTDFERAVWQALLDIPFGRTESYGHLARRLGRAGGARAIGLGVGRNPVGLVVPCHRVVGADGSMTGYGGGLSRKTWLLQHEARP